MEESGYWHERMDGAEKEDPVLSIESTVVFQIAGN